MTDDLKDLFRSESPPTASPQARARGIGAAMARFEEENLAVAQGSRAGARHRSWIGAAQQLLKGLTHMHTIKLNHALMAGASLAAISLVVINIGWLNQGPLAPQFGQDETVLGAEKKNEAPAPASRDDGNLTNAEPADKPAELAGRQAGTAGTEGEFRPKDSKEEVDALVAPAPSMKMRALAKQRSAGVAESQFATKMDSDIQSPGYHNQGRDKFTDITPNPVKITAAEPVSTFSIDVDTASYSFVRGSLMQNTLPQKDAVRVEELINYFPYNYAEPTDKAEPFKATATVFPSPWNQNNKLLHIGIKGFSLNGQEKPRSNLIFLIDTSGSMDEPNKLPLLVNSMKMLVDNLGPEDSISIVTYAGSAGTVLEPTKVKDKAKILSALDNLGAGGSTAGAEGIRQAYTLAEQSFDKAGINRVILATDGDFNVGITDPEELKSFVERKRATGVYLSVLGFGRGNYNDELMQTLAQNGNGNAAYIDTLNEARKVLVDEAASTLFPIAKDVKIQVEFNPATVSEYRLIGYETRLLNREDFNNDKVDAGEIGAGHTVTAIYEFTPKGSYGLVDDLHFGPKPGAEGASSDYAFLKLRYKLPESDTSKLITTPVGAADATPSNEARFATAVAAFGQLLRGGQYTVKFSYDDVIALAQSAKGDDPFGYRGEFLNLVRMAKAAPAMETLKP
jgi:Ca-activated chloride channel homolog